MTVADPDLEHGVYCQPDALFSSYRLPTSPITAVTNEWADRLPSGRGSQCQTSENGAREAAACARKGGAGT